MVITSPTLGTERVRFEAVNLGESAQDLSLTEMVGSPMH